MGRMEGLDGIGHAWEAHHSWDHQSHPMGADHWAGHCSLAGSLAPAVRKAAGWAAADRDKTTEVRRRDRMRSRRCRGRCRTKQACIRRLATHGEGKDAEQKCVGLVPPCHRAEDQRSLASGSVYPGHRQTHSRQNTHPEADRQKRKRHCRQPRWGRKRLERKGSLKVAGSCHRVQEGEGLRASRERRRRRHRGHRERASHRSHRRDDGGS